MSFIDHVDDHINKQVYKDVVVIFILSCLAMLTSCFESDHFIKEYFQQNKNQDARSFRLTAAKAILKDLQVSAFIYQAQIHVLFNLYLLFTVLVSNSYARISVGITDASDLTIWALFCELMTLCTYMKSQ